MKKNARNHVTNFASHISVFITLFTYISSFILIFSSSQSINATNVSSLELQPSLNVFSSLYGAGNNRRFNAVGDFYDTVVNAYYGRSESYLKFDLNLPSGAIITNAQLSMRRYANAGSSFEAKIGKLTQPFDANTGKNTGDFKPRKGVYAITNIDSNDLDFRDYRWDITSLTREWLQGSTNYGLVVYSDTNSQNRGAAFCSTRNDSFCTSQYNPKLIISYSINQPPNVPGLSSPANLYTQKANCDESISPSTGICRTNTLINFSANNIGDGDPVPGDYHSSKFIFTGANNFNSVDITNSGNINYSGNFADGITSWHVNSVDNLGLQSSSLAYQFITDTTPSNIPILNSIPQFTKGVGINDTSQVTITSNVVNDNVSPSQEISYLLEYSTDSNFSSSKTFYKTWQTNNSIFQIGPKGADEIAGNDDDISDKQTYYFRVKAKDSISYIDGNISNYSNIISTTIDSTLPDITNFAVSDNRFSPNNFTSLGYRDSINFNLTYIEKNVGNAQLDIYSDPGQLNVVRTISASSNPCNNSSQDCQNAIFNWDGKDNNGNYLNDGIYSAIAKVTDLATNISSSTSILIIIDNTGANISISSPVDNFWTNQNIAKFTGQVTAPHDPTKQDTDIQNLFFQQENNQWENLTYNENNFFEKKVNLNIGNNIFHFKTQDTVENKIDITRNIYYDNSAPVLNHILPEDVTKNTKPTISFTITDKSNGDIINSGMQIGDNPNDFDLSLSYQKYNSTTNDYSTIRKDLVKNGINLDPVLVSNLKCAAVDSTFQANNFTVSRVINCSLDFLADLQPDTEYTILITARDVAGNIVTNDSHKFNLDSHNFSILTSPVEGAYYSSKSVQFKGTASKNSHLTFTNSTLNISKIITLIENLDSTGQDNELDTSKLFASNFTVKCGIFKDVDNNLDTKDEEVCDWSVKIYQKYVDSDSDIQNTNSVMSTDEVGNSVLITRNIIINLHKINLEISSDINFFSPNGDGNQDGIRFSHSVSNPSDPNSPPVISNYELKISRLENNSEILIRQFNGSNLLSDTFWDGKDQGGNFVKDGEYHYQLNVTTSDNIHVSSVKKSVFAKTKLTDEVVITNPYSGVITTKGVITVQGQAPKSAGPICFVICNFHGVITVEICVNNLQTSVDCDFTQKTKADEYGFFSAIVILPRTASQQIHHQITAKAFDSYGNVTQKSNLVEVIQDTIDPFNSVTITPALTGINSEEDYQKFLRGEISIDKLRTVILKANVTQNTEKLQYKFADYTNLNQLPNNPNYKYIALVNNKTQLDPNLNPYGLNAIKYNYNVSINSSIENHNCSQNVGCDWEYYLPIQPNWGGIYDVQFTAKKGDTVQSITAGFKTDGSLPSSPIIMIVEKWDNDKQNWVQINSIQDQYYTNNSKIRIRGAADPNILLKWNSGNTSVGKDFHANEFGIFEYVFDNFKTENAFQCNQNSAQGCVLGNLNLSLNAYKTDSNGSIICQIPSTNLVKLNYDIIAPQLQNISRITSENNINGWAKTGDSVGYNFTANESLIYADTIKEDGYVTVMNSQDSRNNMWSGRFNLDRKDEGYYFPKIQLQDYAGNLTTLDSITSLYGLPDWRFYIDNTIPDSPSIDTSLWGGPGGIYADGSNPVPGRTNPFYVTKGRTEKFAGQAEKNQRVDIMANNSLLATVNISDQNCKIQSSDKTVVQNIITLTVKYGSICDWSYEYTFPDNGANDNFGVPQNAYIFQFRTRDSASNLSLLTPQLVIYHDTQSPQDIQIEQISSSSYSLLPTLNSNYITKDNQVSISTNAERNADIQYWLNFKSNLNANRVGEYRFFQNPASRKSTQKFTLNNLSDENTYCMKLINNRRTGICNDGIYSFQIKATDTAGNGSNSKIINIERDTVAPADPIVSEPYICGTDICVDVSGETGASLILNENFIGKIGNDKETYKLIYNYEFSKSYDFDLYLSDNAKNNSNHIQKNIVTPYDEHGRGSVEGASTDSPFADKSGVKLSPVNMEITTDARGANPQVSYKVPTPELTYVYTHGDNTVDINGIAVQKYHYINVKMHVQYFNYNDARSFCSVVSIDNADYLAKNCMQNMMGISEDEIKNLPNKIDSECKAFFVPLPFCDKPSSFAKKEDYTLQKFVDNSEVSIFRTTYPDIHIIGPVASNTKYLDRIWNDSAQGNFTYHTRISDDLKSGDTVKTISRIYGKIGFSWLETQVSDDQKKNIPEFTSINYGNTDGQHSDKDMHSEFSNSLLVDKSEYVIIKGKEAKVLDVPYFNQNLDADNRRDVSPWYGGQVCGAASSVMIAGYYGKINYDKNDPVNTLRPYVFLDNPVAGKDGVTKQLQSIPKGTCGGGAYGVTKYGECTNGSLAQSIQKYLDRVGISNESNLDYNFLEIKKSIDKGKPIIVDIKKPIGHYFVIVGYIKDTNKVVVNDPYRDLQNNSNGPYDTSGKWAVYDLNNKNVFSIINMIFIK